MRTLLQASPAHGEPIWGAHGNINIVASLLERGLLAEDLGQTLAEKNGFVTATKLGTTNKFFVAATKNFAPAAKCFVIELNILSL